MQSLAEAGPRRSGLGHADREGAAAARVLILSLFFTPDGVSTAQIMAELAVDLKRAGHDVSVISTQPHYNRDVEAEARQPLTPAWGGLLFRSEIDGIPVVHTRTLRKTPSLARRLVGWMMFHALALVAALRLPQRPEVVIVPSPLLSLGLIAWLIGRSTGARYIYNVQELYPDLAVRMGHLRNPTLIRILRALERFVYDRASAVTVIAPTMRAAVERRGIPPAKVHYIPNFVDVDDLVPGPKVNAFSQEHGITDRFVVSYAGNMGHAQGLEVLLEVAARLRSRRDICFLFVGGGVSRASLERQAKERGLTNVQFVPHQPYARVSEIYGASDLCVVPVLESIGSDAVPSKVYRIMACERPILALTAADSELARIVRDAGAGDVVRPGDCDAIETAIKRYADMPRDECVRIGASGRAYSLTHVARPVVTAQYAALVTAVAGRDLGVAQEVRR